MQARTQRALLRCSRHTNLLWYIYVSNTYFNPPFCKKRTPIHYTGNWSYFYWSKHIRPRQGTAAVATSNPPFHHITFPEQTTEKLKSPSWDHRYEPDTSFKETAADNHSPPSSPVSCPNLVQRFPSLHRMAPTLPPVSSTPLLTQQSVSPLRRAALTKCKAKTRFGLQCKLPALAACMQITEDCKLTQWPAHDHYNHYSTVKNQTRPVF